MNDEEFNEALRHAPVFGQSIFDLADGLMTVAEELIRLLVKKQVITWPEAISALEIARGPFTDKPPEALDRYVVDGILEGLRLFSARDAGTAAP